jgi:hypothetical protein
MEALGRKATRTRKRQERKRKRFSSSTKSASEMSSDAREDSMYEDVPISEDNGHEGMDENAVWSFVRENAGALVERIVSSNEWRENAMLQENNIRALQAENKELRSRLAISEGAIVRCENSIKKLEEKLTDMTVRSMKDNVLIKNIEEKQYEKDSDVEEKVFSIFKHELKIPDFEMEKITVERAHRIGDARHGKARQVVAKLNSKGKSVVMRHLKYLNKEGTIKINEQFPPEVHANREKLWSVFIDAKSQGKEARWNADKLTIDGRRINPPTDRNKDINLNVTDEAMKISVSHTSVKSKKNNHFQAHTVNIDSADQVMPAIKALTADYRVAGATHVSYAYRIGTEDNYISNWEDDGDWGAGKSIMDSIRTNSAYNTLICVTRWYGGQHLGPERHELITEMANTAITQSGF